MVTLDALRAAGLGTRKGIPVKILARGELAKGLTVHAHALQRDRARAHRGRRRQLRRRRALAGRPVTCTAASGATPQATI